MGASFWWVVLPSQVVALRHMLRKDGKIGGPVGPGEGEDGERLVLVEGKVGAQQPALAIEGAIVAVTSVVVALVVGY